MFNNLISRNNHVTSKQTHISCLQRARPFINFQYYSVVRERLSLSIVYHSSLWSNNACQTRVCFQTSDIRIWCQIATQGLRLLGPGSGQLSVQHSSHSGLSYRNCKGPITCHFHNLEQHLSHVTHCQVHLTRDMSLSSPGLSWHTLTLTTIMSWPESHLETEDGESSVGDRGECTLVHAGALYCRLYNVNGKFYYFSNMYFSYEFTFL